MNILFDGRALQSPIRSGVPRVAEWWLRELSRSHEVTVFTTGWKRQIPAFAGMTHVKIPNKLLHLSLFLFRWPKLDRLVSRQTGVQYDMVFVPNIHFFASDAPYALLVHDLSFLVLPQFFSPFERFVHALKRPLRLIREARSLFAVSRSTKRDIAQFAYRTDVETIDISVATTHDLHVRGHGDRKDIVFISTTEPRKNLEQAILGFLASGISDRLLIIGSITRAGRELQHRYRDHANIVWLGVISDAERTTLLARAKALLYPSKFEGYGLPLAEAQALRTPIITSAVTSMPEVAPKAILIDPTRPETIALALKMLY